MPKCNEPIAIEYIWTYERKYACIKHAAQIERIANAIGIGTSPRFIISDRLCQQEVRDKEDKNGDMEI